MRLRRFNEEVLFAPGTLLELGRRDVRRLKARAARARRGRIRLCLHRGLGSAVHEMLIVLPKNAYVRPHKHRRPESFLVVEGKATLVLFDENGRVTRRVPVGEYRSGRRFYYKLGRPCFHTVLVESGVLVFQETKGGPFRRSETRPAPWSPPETDREGGLRFLKGLG